MCFSFVDSLLHEEFMSNIFQWQEVLIWEGNFYLTFCFLTWLWDHYNLGNVSAIWKIIESGCFHGIDSLYNPLPNWRNRMFCFLPLIQRQRVEIVFQGIWKHIGYFIVCSCSPIGFSYWVTGFFLASLGNVCSLLRQSGSWSPVDVSLILYFHLLN